MKAVENPQLKRYVIDDSQYLLVNEFFDRAKEAGYQKYTDMALNLRNLVHAINQKAPDDVVFYFLHHTEFDSNSGRVKAKTVGKDDRPVSDSGRVLRHCASGPDRWERALLHYTVGRLYNRQVSGGMFPDVKIDNDLKLVDDSLRTYWGL